MEMILGNFMLAILFIVGMGVLEYFLAKRENKWPGLILPIFSFFYSLVLLLAIAKPSDGSSVLPGILTTLVVGNIPTVFFLVIYTLTRSSEEKKKKGDDEMKKMKIQDL